MHNNIAPIVLFTYKRYETLQKTVQCLSDNFLASDSDLIIYSDGAKNIDDKEMIAKIRSYLKTISGFKSVTIHESITNKGLAASIIYGVSDVLKVYPSVIVLEDDLITSKNFLSFMNQCLEQYKCNEVILSVSGYTPNIGIEEFCYDAFFLNRSWSWGWATWQNRWVEVDWGVNTYTDFTDNNNLKREFSNLGSDVNSMLKKQMNGNIDSWYIRFLFHQFNKKGLTVYPIISKVYNNGFDDLATHNKGSKKRFFTKVDLSNNLVFDFPPNIDIDKVILRKFKKINSIKTRICNKLINIFFYVLQLKN
jgi:hypothetical protein